MRKIIVLGFKWDEVYAHTSIGNGTINTYSPVTLSSFIEKDLNPIIMWVLSIAQMIKTCLRINPYHPVMVRRFERVSAIKTSVPPSPFGMIFSSER